MSTTTLRIYEALAEQIIRGQIAPGHKLEEQVLAEIYSVSRTPIREVLKGLAARGLVEFIPRRGAIVAQIGLEEMADMLEAECELEALCAKLASQRMNALEKSRLQDIHERSQALIKKADRNGYLILNSEFHDAICAGVQNKTLNGTITQLRDRLAPFRRTQSVALNERLQRSYEEHEAIVAAIVKGDAEAAYDAMRLHNARLSTGVIEVLRERNGAIASPKSSKVAKAILKKPHSSSRTS
jgi:DNA-binding GntR family transcriptional regulator